MKNLASYVKTAKTVITANSPVLLLGTTIAGVATTAVLSAKAGWNARGIVDDERAKRYASPEPPYDTFYDYKHEFETAVPELTPQEVVKLTWPQFAIPLISASGTIAAAVGTHTIHTKRAHAMSALYAVTSHQLDDMSERAEELLGPKKAQQLKDDLAQRNADRFQNEDDCEILLTGDGTELCHDAFTGRWFMSSIQKMEGVINELNRMLVDGEDVDLNEFYTQIGLDAIPMGQYVGWGPPARVEGVFGSVLHRKEGRSAIDVTFRPAPKKLGA